jgi:hypothetical protein
VRKLAGWVVATCRSQKKFYACTSIAFLAGIISWSVDITLTSLLKVGSYGFKHNGFGNINFI